MRMARRLLAYIGAALGLSIGGPTMAEPVGVGAVLRCPSEAGLPPVLAWIGRVERWSDHGVTGDRADVTLTHLQLQAEGGDPLRAASHAPFEASALTGCKPLPEAPERFDQAAFEEGYALWLDAVPSGAGAFTISPAEALWAMLGVRDGALNR